MDEGSFTQNFTWFEWGFVDPSDLPQDSRSQPDVNGYTATTYPGYGSAGLQKSDEDHRWPT